MCSASEVVLFERTTFLIIARSGDIAMFDSDSDDEHQQPASQPPTPNGPPSSHANGNGEANGSGKDVDESEDVLSPERFEKISELVKAFKISCR